MHEHMHANTFVCQFGDKGSASTVAAGAFDASKCIKAGKQVYNCLRTKTTALCAKEQWSIWSSREALVISYHLKPRPDIMLCHFQILPQDIDRLPPPCPHDGSSVISGTEQILRSTNAE